MLNKIHPAIRPATYIFLIVSVVSIALVLWSHNLATDSEQKQLSEKRAMRLWKNKIDSSKRSNDLISEYEKGYMQLVKNNVVGDENRLNWIESLQKIANVKGFPSVKYNISSQQKINDSKSMKKLKGLAVYRSEMAIDVEMLHEEDLFVLLNDLEKRAKGLFVVNSCNINRNNRKAGSGMRARCTLGWYTFKSSEDNTQRKGNKKSRVKS